MSEGNPAPRWRRILIKVSGEAFAGGKGFGLDPDTVDRIAGELRAVADLGVGVAVVVGGGNIVRGATTATEGVDRVTADHMGMLGTTINALALMDSLEQIGIPTRVQTAINIVTVAEPFIRRRAIRHLEKGRVVILAAGTGNPFFSTDTAAALRALELKADVVLKATQVDGVYDKDPKRHPDAVRFPRVTYRECIDRGLAVMDMSAFAICMENDLPIVVFDLAVPGNIRRVALGAEEVGTIITKER